MKQKYREMLMTFLHGLIYMEYISEKEFQALKNVVFKMKEVKKWELKERVRYASLYYYLDIT